MSEGINCTPAKIIQWFTNSEKCLMHSNTAPIKIIQINLSENQIDALIEQGKKIKIREILETRRVILNKDSVSKQDKEIDAAITVSKKETE